MWRLISVAAALAAVTLPVSAQEPTLDQVLKRAAAYVAAFRQQLSGIVAEEVYTQRIVNTSRFVDSVQMMPTRRLKSDLLLVKPGGADRYVELRDVYEVDGAPVRDRQARLEKLITDRSAAADATIGEIIAASAHYNIGGITRNINTPLMALIFLDAAHQDRFQFKHIDAAQSKVFPDKQEASLNDAPVFRTTAEMWNIEYRERGGNTVIRTPSGDNLQARGRFWINPANGSVLISELSIDGGGVKATVTVSYQSEPLMGFLVPVEMHESYLGRGERITGDASYGKFRQIAK